MFVLLSFPEEGQVGEGEVVSLSAQPAQTGSDRF